MESQLKYSRIRFLILSLICLLGVTDGFSQDSIIDMNMDGSCDGESQILNQGLEFTVVNTCFKIGIIQTGEYLFPVDRLTSLGYTNFELLADTSGISIFKDYDIIYLPTGWADNFFGSLEDVEAKSEDYLAYVASGGNLLVEQPNPYEQPNSSVTPAILPYPITFYNYYNTSDFPPIAVNATHEITIGLDASELAFPSDPMVSVDEHYEILVVGATSMDPSLVVATFEKGKILVCTANSYENSIYPMSDEFYERLFIWLGKRTYCTTPVSACESYTWIDGNIYFENNNTATFALTDVLGCDSIVALDLTIIENAIDATVSQADQTLTVNTSGATYQWLDCANDFTPIADATEQSFTPDSDGVYAVEIIDGICMDTSACLSIVITGITDLFVGNTEVYPNPTTQKINIDYKDVFIQSVKVFSVTGQLVRQYKSLNATFVEVEIDETAGVYFVEVSTDLGTQVHKVIKE